jgi:hypothetical protein
MPVFEDIAEKDPLGSLDRDDEETILKLFLLKGMEGDTVVLI